MKLIEKMNPVIAAIYSFDHEEEVHGIVKNKYNKFSMLISTNDVYFFGYKDQCEKHLSEYPEGIIVDKLLEKIIER